MKSPCINICILFPGTNYCSGCYRRTDEIAEWSRMSDLEHKLIYARIYERAYEEIRIKACELGFVEGSRDYDNFVENEIYKIQNRYSQ